MPFGSHLRKRRYLRIPSEVAKTVSNAVYELNKHTAGGRLRFVTDSPFVSIVASMLIKSRKIIIPRREAPPLTFSWTENTDRPSFIPCLIPVRTAT
ncbi:MAG: hypothetical protein E7609_01615 [Ruminococcaceae bacterium]|nr:hypothetical protein [Oscillospiraceae bacterium]